MPQGTAEAVLVRAIEPALGIEFMRQNRAVKDTKDLGSGPGKRCQAMLIDKKQDGADLCDAHSLLLVAENPQREEYLHRHGPIMTTARIGITKAAFFPLRFVLKNSPFLSKPVPVSGCAGTAGA